jgi:hypothetical protein
LFDENGSKGSPNGSLFDGLENGFGELASKSINETAFGEVGLDEEAEEVTELDVEEL